MKNKLQETLSEIQESFFDVLDHLDLVNIRIRDLTEYADYLRVTIWNLENKIGKIKQLVNEQEKEAQEALQNLKNEE